MKKFVFSVASRATGRLQIKSSGLGTRMSSAFFGKKGEVMLVMTKYAKNYGSTICQSLANELFYVEDLCILN